MKFKVRSIYFDYSNKDWVEVMQQVCIKEGKEFFLICNTLQELKSDLDKLSKLYDDFLCSKYSSMFPLRSDIRIMFEENKIILYDYYME